MNIPYVKKYDELGNLTNPIIDSYKNHFPNRQKRHEKTPRFHGQSKNRHLTVMKNAKYLRQIQTVVCKDGSIKRIMHYILQ